MISDVLIISNQDIAECLSAVKPSIPFREKFHSGIFNDILVYFSEADNIPAGPIPYHFSTVLEHTLRCMDEVVGDPLAVWMALCHDCGKVLTPKNELPHHYGHDIRGKQLAEIWATNCNLPKKYKIAGTLTSCLHMKAAHYDILRNRTKYDLLMEIYHNDISTQFWKVVSSDSKNNIGDQAVNDLDYILKIISENKTAKNIKSIVCEKMKHKKTNE